MTVEQLEGTMAEQPEEKKKVLHHHRIHHHLIMEDQVEGECPDDRGESRN